MTQVQRASNTQAKQNREFIGKAWKNIVNKVGSQFNGTEFIRVSLDRDIDTIQIEKGSSLVLWPNKKREGKKDADYRVSLVYANA